jgi:hypothetical protein
MGKLSGSKRPYNFQVEVTNIRKDKRNNMTDENKNSLKTICNGLCENPFLFNQLDEGIKEVTQLKKAHRFVYHFPQSIL